MTDTIEIRELSYQVEGFALKDVNLTVPSRSRFRQQPECRLGSGTNHN